jgi:hypothetical protein
MRRTNEQMRHFREGSGGAPLYLHDDGQQKIDSDPVVIDEDSSQDCGARPGEVID